MKIQINLKEIFAEDITSFKASAVKGSSVTVDVLNSTGFAVGDFVLIGRLGEEISEVTYISAVTDSDTMQFYLFNFDHPNNTSIRKIYYDQIKVEKSINEGQNWTVVSTINIVGDKEIAEYVTSGSISTDWYRTRFYNTTTTSYSAYSNIIQNRGEVISNVLSAAARRLKIDGDNMITFDDLFQAFADGDMTIATEIMRHNPEFFQNTFDVNIEEGLSDYALDESIVKINRIDLKISTTSNDYLSSSRIEDDYPLSSYSREFGTHYLFYDATTKLYTVRLKETPSEDVTAGIKVYATVEPQRVEDITDTPNIPNANMNSHVLLDYVLEVAYRDFKDNDRKADHYLQKFNAGMMDIVQRVNMADGSEIVDNTNSILGNYFNAFNY